MKKKFKDVERILKQALPFLFISGIGELLAGIVLKNYLDYIELVPGIFVLIPALMNLRGAVSSSMAARLGTAYHLGLIKGKRWFQPEIKENFYSATILAVLVSIASSVFAYFVCVAFGIPHMPLHIFVLIATSASIISALFFGLINIAAVRFSIRENLDPDNITIPLLTTFGDIFMVFLVYVLVVFFVGVVI